MSLPTPYIYAFLGAFFAAFLDTASRAVMKKGADAMSLSVIMSIGGGVMLLPVLPMPPLTALGIKSVIFLGVSAVFWTLMVVYDFKASGSLDVAVGAIVGALRFVLLNISGMLLFGESLSIVNWIGISLIVVGICYGADLRGVQMVDGVRYKMLSVLTATTAITSDKYLTTFTDTNTVVVVSYFMPGFLLLLYRPTIVKTMSNDLKRDPFMITIATALFAAVGTLILLGIARGNLNTTMTISQSKIFFALALGYFLLKERDNLFQRGVAACCCLGGIFLATFI